MGALDYEDQSCPLPPGPWEHRNWVIDNEESAQQPATYSTNTGIAPGLTTYRSVAEKESDRLSGYLSDDASSNADSVFDTSSVLSSQSSNSSAGSEASDDAFDGRDVFVKQPLETLATQPGTRRQNDDQIEILTGLQRRSVNEHQLEINSSNHNSSQNVPRSVPISGYPEKGNRRRSGSQGSVNGPPCRLKRDTDSADCFVMLLITFASRLITAIWPLSASPPMMSSCFNGAGVLPLEVFIHETLRRSKTSYSTLQVALFYLVLLKDKLSDQDFTKEQSKPEDGQQQSSGPPKCRAMQCGRRMFLAALMLASKYLQDRNYSTRAWSKISGLRIPEINENETEYLRCIDYRLHMKREAFENWSKIVLTLSKLSKVQPGCTSNLELPRKSGPGSDAILAGMTSASTPCETFSTAAHYSTQWWTDLVKKIEPEIINDGLDTEAFLRDNIPMDEVAEVLARHENALPTPPTSPDASPPHITDMTFNETLPSRGNQTPSIPTPTELRAPSPSRTSLPIRPMLSNLPTPQSTPRGTDSCPWQTSANNQQQQNLRCSASADVLRSLRKNCIMNANLDRCPPPRPQSLNLPSVSSSSRPAESTQACYSRSATPAVFSPTSSVLSESTPRTSRSRSSSTSSNSSWSSFVSVPPRSLQAQIQSRTSSPLGRQVSSSDNTPTQVLRRKPNFSSEGTPRAYQQNMSGVAHFYDEGYGSGEELRAKAALQNSQSEFEAVEALMNMRSSTDTAPRPQYQSNQSTPTPRGHKRTISKTTEPLQEHVSRLLQSRSIEDQVMEDMTPTRHVANSERQWQTPTKVWAIQKKPAPNSMDTKRVALYCASSASDLARHYLRDQMTTA